MLSAQTAWSSPCNRVLIGFVAQADWSPAPGLQQQAARIPLGSRPHRAARACCSVGERPDVLCHARVVGNARREPSCPGRALSASSRACRAISWSLRAGRGVSILPCSRPGIQYGYDRVDHLDASNLACGSCQAGLTPWTNIGFQSGSSFEI